MKKSRPDEWYPFFIDKWLFGSTRIDLKPDERSVFVDLMTLSKKHDGYIMANRGIPYLEKQLCGLLNISKGLLKRTIDRCIKVKKIRKLADGTLFIVSHNVYKLSSRQKRKYGFPLESSSAKTEHGSEKTEHGSAKAVPRGEERRIEKKRIEERKEKPDSPSLPAIPKGLDFKVQDELKLQLAEIRQLRRKLADKESLKRAPGSEQEILCKLKLKEKKYCDLIEDFS